MTRTYVVTLPARGDKRVTRELPADHADAREQAAAIGRLNAAWDGSEWIARNGDCFRLGSSGEIVEMTIDEP